MAIPRAALCLEPPFVASRQLCAELDHADNGQAPSQHLPGFPRIPLQDHCRVLEFLEKEYSSPDLDRMAHRLWWMSKQDSANISPLHRQSVKRRNIIVTEDPKLHLVWIQDRIFIKPLPLYLTSYAFWQDYLGSDADDAARTRRDGIRRAALGYLRTYLHLVRYESDFRIAQDPILQLIPPGITWKQFCDFTSNLAQIADRDVSERYAYGEIKLTRLNLYAPFLLGRSHFQRVEYQYGSYFARFYGPILFIFGIASIFLSGLQVTVAVKDIGSSTPSSQTFLDIALWVSVAMMLCALGVLIVFVVLFIYKVVWEWKFALRDRHRLQRLEEGRLGLN